MKKLALTITIALASLVVASAQGTIKMYNISSSFLITTNDGTSSGVLSKTANSYYFALLTSATAPSSADPTGSEWSVAKTGGVNIVGNNYTLIAGGLTGNGAANGVSVDGWAPGSTLFVELVGWSANLGTSWDQINAQLVSGTWSNYGFYGVSGMGQVASGGVGTPASPAASLFGVGGIPSGFVLNATPVPEPATMALGALGGAALLLFRRRK